ncbi:MAG: ATP-binding cassette domain-containing protein [Rikenellaceae bacterium]|nr:ATP-binding cassette domain-containing protein [Rikenellaceae bacterium]
MIDKNVIELRGASIYHIRDARKRIGKGRNRLRGCELVLSDVDFAVGRGEFVYLIGKVGSGKSPLLKTLYGEVPLAEGRGFVAGYDLRTLRRREIPYLRRRMGIVFQDYQLLSDRNVFSNLHYVMKATGWKSETDIRRRIEEVLRIVGLTNKEYKMPFQLSGGEQQRLAIARALVNSPDVLLADEPTGNLDPAAANGILELFREISERGCSVVMSTHNIGIIEEYPARTFRFMQGRVEELDIAPILASGAQPQPTSRV